MKNGCTHCSACFISDSLQALSSSQAQPNMSQKHGQDVCPHAGDEKRPPAPWDRCSCGRRASAQVPLKKSLVGDPEQDPGLKETSMSAECKSCTVVDESIEVLEVKNELQRSPAALHKSCLSSPRSPYHTTTSVDFSLDVIRPPSLRVGAAGEPKLPRTWQVSACLLPFGPAATSICLVHSAVASCQRPGHLALVSKQLPGNVKKNPNLPALLPLLLIPDSR